MLAVALHTVMITVPCPRTCRHLAPARARAAVAPQRRRPPPPPPTSCPRPCPCPLASRGAHDGPPPCRSVRRPRGGLGRRVRRAGHSRRRRPGAWRDLVRALPSAIQRGDGLGLHEPHVLTLPLLISLVSDAANFLRQGGCAETLVCRFTGSVYECDSPARDGGECFVGGCEAGFYCGGTNTCQGKGSVGTKCQSGDQWCVCHCASCRAVV